MEIKNRKILDTDILIIGGGTAGCYAALTIAEQSDAKVIIAEKANIKRSGCYRIIQRGTDPACPGILFLSICFQRNVR